jgi:hypothetical protein
MESLQLSEILAAIVNEFENAAVSADVSREHWRQVYESNSLLQEFAPSRLRISEVSVSLPLVITDINKARPKPIYITSKQILRILPGSLSLDMRKTVADATEHFINQEKRFSFANKRFLDTAMNFIRNRIMEFTERTSVLASELERTKNELKMLQRHYTQKINIPNEREARFAYRTEEIAQVEIERIVRLNFKLEID